MASENATALAVRKEESVEVVDAKPCPDMLALLADAKAAEKLVPWTDEEIDKATAAELGERVRLVCSHFKFTLLSEHDFVMRFRKEFLALREKSRQQGRRLPIPGCPDWTELKKEYFRMSSRQIDRLLEDPDKPKAERKPNPKSEEREPEGLEPEVLEPDQPPPVTDAEVARIHEAAAADMLPEVEDLVAEEQWQPEPPDPEGIWLDFENVTPETVTIILNDVYADKQGRHEAVREMLRLLDKCVLWEISYASSEERSSRLQSADRSAQHVFPSEAAQEVLKRGGFWSAKALIGEADIHVTSDSYPNGCGVSLDHFKQHVLGNLRLGGEVKTRMLGRVNWYCHPDHEAALKAAKKPEGPEFHYAEGEFQKGGGSASAPCRAEGGSNDGGCPKDKRLPREQWMAVAAGKAFVADNGEFIPMVLPVTA
jgi:hypothetical protein